MERSQAVRGIDEEGVRHLALVLEQTADDLGAARAALITTFAEVDRASTVPARLAAVEGWLRGQATDVRRRGTLISHDATAPQFHKDVLSGLHLQGFIGVGLGYRHLGQETRTVTEVFDCGDGVRSTIRSNEQRSVYEVWFGVGYGPVGWGTSDPTREHSSWKTKKRSVSYAEADGRPVRRPARPGPIGTGACPA